MLVLDGVMVLAPSTLYVLLPIGYSHFVNQLSKILSHGRNYRLCTHPHRAFPKTQVAIKVDAVLNGYSLQVARFHGEVATLSS